MPQPTRHSGSTRKKEYHCHIVSLPFYSSLHIHLFSQEKLIFLSFYSSYVVSSCIQGKSLRKNRTMEEKMGLLFLVMLGSAWACGARELADPENWSSNAANSGNSELSRKPDVCALCQEYTAQAVDYLNENKTQNEIIDILHNTCSQLHSFKQKCITLVDYYAPLFFLEVATIQPGEFCHKVNLCQNIANIALQVQENSCEFCKDTISALLDKLKDPDTELEIMETLLKVCSSVDKYADKCKRIVFEYGPLVFDNAEKFLEMTDVCTVLHACKDSAVVSQKAFVSDS